MPTFTVQVSDEMLATLAKMLAVELGKSSGRSPVKDTYTCKEAAARLGVHQETIRRQVKAGTIPRVPCLSKLIIPGAAIDALVNPSI